MIDKRAERTLMIQKYFTKEPEKPSYLLAALFAILGLLFLSLAFLLSFVVLLQGTQWTQLARLVVCGIAPIAGIGILGMLVAYYNYWTTKTNYQKALAYTEPKPTDAQMDKWLEEDKHKIAAMAFRELELTNEHVLNENDPLIVIGPKTSTHVAKGKDGVFRFSKYEIVVIYLTDYQLAACTCTLDFVTGQVFLGETQEYHYSDVVSVSTCIENSPFEVIYQDGQRSSYASHQQFALSVANGDRIKVTVSFPSSLLNKLQPTGAEKTVTALRTVLRKKKGGVKG